MFKVEEWINNAWVQRGKFYTSDEAYKLMDCLIKCGDYDHTNFKVEFTNDLS